MSDTLPLDLDFFLDQDTELGHLVRNYELLCGTYLVYKMPMAEESKGDHGKKILLADGYRRRAVGNRILIRGLVIRSSAPFREIRAKKKWVNLPAEQAELDGLPGTARIKYFPRIQARLSRAQVEPGRGILYNAYNICHMDLPDIHDELVVVREIDVFGHFPINSAERYEIGDFAMSRHRVY
jgi:hypothetical protein